ncbi:hypothetical protein XELAEV_18028978mg [Xenopus laevis]|uniref:Uncharacterized protein n=1 Tax=Xenopus laevis TaxID=8355 RepID=A0A974CSI3_XENLA|nr:hypothetical protein XELAEV_18028978mg [Xenopus laevis]
MADSLATQVRDRVLQQGSGWVEELLAELVPPFIHARDRTQRTAEGPARRSRLSPSPPRPNTRSARKRATARSASVRSKAANMEAGTPPVISAPTLPKRNTRVRAGKRPAARVPTPSPATVQAVRLPASMLPTKQSARATLQRGPLLTFAPDNLTAPPLSSGGDSDPPQSPNRSEQDSPATYSPSSSSHGSSEDRFRSKRRKTHRGSRRFRRSRRDDNGVQQQSPAATSPLPSRAGEYECSGAWVGASDQNREVLVALKQILGKLDASSATPQAELPSASTYKDVYFCGVSPLGSHLSAEIRDKILKN